MFACKVMTIIFCDNTIIQGLFQMTVAPKITVTGNYYTTVFQSLSLSLAIKSGHSFRSLKVCRTMMIMRQDIAAALCWTR